MVASAGTRSRRSVNLIVICLVLYALGTYAYATLRYRGYWNDVDTQALSRTIQYANEDGSVLYSRESYGNGLAYQAISVFVLQVTGLSVDALQLYAYHALNILVPILAFVAYRALIHDSMTALLATLLLYMQPDFLYVTWRGSHEKVTWALVLLLLFLLARSLTAKPLSRYSLTFYLVAFGLIATNAFFASSFMTALAISFFAGTILLRIRQRIHQAKQTETMAHIQRLLYLTLVCALMLYIFIFYIYPPVLSLVRAFRSLADGITALLLNAGGGQSAGADPYSFVGRSWVDPRLYLILTLFSWVSLVVAFFVWLVGIFGFILRPRIEAEDLPRLLLWLLFPSMAFQLALSVLADQVRAVGSNVQVRLFTPLMIIAFPLVALGISTIRRRLRPKILRPVVMALMAVLAVCFSVMALVKTTNEPVLSNNWLFNTASERMVMDWILQHSAEPVIWTDYLGRLRTAMLFYNMDLPDVFLRSGYVYPPTTRYFAASEIDRLLWKRRERTMAFLDNNIIYDSGKSQMYYRRPRTIYQE